MKALLCCFIVLFSSAVLAEPVVIKMGYRDTAKLPYIEAAPSNAGLYFDLYSEAARRIGATLEVVRLPKARVILALESGDIDFYPGYSFSSERALFSYWLRNGLIQRDVVAAKPETHLQIKAGNTASLTQGLAVGTPSKLDGFKTLELTQLTLDRVFRMLEQDRIDVYVAEESTLRFHLRNYPHDGIELYDDVIKDYYYSHAGFSIHSPIFESQMNPNFDDNQDVSIENFPIIAAPGTTVDEFAKALWQMYEEGYSQRLFQRYFH